MRKHQNAQIQLPSTYHNTNLMSSGHHVLPDMTVDVIEHLGRSNLLQHRHQVIRIDVIVIVEEGQIATSPTVVDHPLKTHHHLQRAVVVVILEILLDDVIKLLRLQPDPVLQTAVSEARAQQEDTANLDVGNEPLARPCLAYHAALVEVVDVRLDEEHQEDILILTVGSLTLAVIVDDEGVFALVDWFYLDPLAVQQALDHVTQVDIQRVGEVCEWLGAQVVDDVVKVREIQGWEQQQHLSIKHRDENYCFCAEQSLPTCPDIYD